MRKIFAFILELALVTSLAQFKPCLECLYSNQQQTSYFCKSSEICRFANDTQCAFDDIIWEPEECVEVIEPCESMVFNSSTFQAKYDFEKTLIPGSGCWLNMSREVNGSWGGLSVKVDIEEDQGNILVFDENLPLENAYGFDPDVPIIKFKTSMQYTDEGWLPRQVFVANRNERAPASFIYTYQGANGLALTLSILLISFSQLI